LVFDVTDDHAVAKAASELDVALDVLVNNAGIIGYRSANTIDYRNHDVFADVLAINTIAPLRVSQAFLPHLRRSDRPRIITISSQMGMLNYQKSDCIAYRASKSAVNKVMQGIATDLKDEKIAVQMLHPGWVRTDMGGDHADLSVEESASGIADRLENLTIAQTGTFVSYDGSAMPW
ncbi:MAG: SDR family NAD(P)-dependent oxidoreductase, partial [Pseudomonadota bacterium]